VNARLGGTRSGRTVIESLIALESGSIFGRRGDEMISSSWPADGIPAEPGLTIGDGTRAPHPCQAHQDQSPADWRNVSPSDLPIWRPPSPFVWQHGSRLILLDDEPDGWIMAELQFDERRCRYMEVRRAVYEETREAIGAVLSRSLASGDHAAVDSALCLHEWFSTHYGISIVSDVLSSPDARSVEFTA
jgi:hypothetical protein